MASLRKSLCFQGCRGKTPLSVLAQGGLVRGLVAGGPDSLTCLDSRRLACLLASSTNCTSVRFASSTPRPVESAKPEQQQIPLFAVAGAKGSSASVPSYLDDSRWSSMAATGVHSSLLGKLQARFKFLKATPVQEAAFPVILKALEKCPEASSSFDVTIHSETGTGKTLAYVLPLLTHLLECTKTASGLHHAKTRYVIVTPTRELAHQVYSVIDELIRPGNKRSAVAESYAAGVRSREGKGPTPPANVLAAATEAGAGGGSLKKKREGSLFLGSPSASALLRVSKMVGEVTQAQLHAIDAGEAPHIIIGTPYTLAKLIPSRINCGQLSALIMDEADELVRNYSIASIKQLVTTATKMKHRPAIIAVSATPSHGLSTFLHANARVGSMRKVNLLSKAATSGSGGNAAMTASATTTAPLNKPLGLAASLRAQEEELASSKGSEGASSSVSDSYYLSRANLGLALPPTLHHLLMRVRRPEDSYQLFTQWLAAAKPSAVLSFHNSSESLEAAEVYLKSKNIQVRVLGAAYDVAQRCKSIGDISAGRAQVLLCTEMGARGLDIPRLSHVLNFDMPSGAREYVHRAGRVGRISSLTPNRRGTVVTMAVGDEQYLQALRMLHRDLHLSVSPMPIPRDVWGPHAGTIEAETETEGAAMQPSATSILVAPLMRAECKRGELVLSPLQAEVGRLLGTKAGKAPAAAASETSAQASSPPATPASEEGEEAKQLA